MATLVATAGPTYYGVTSGLSELALMGYFSALEYSFVAMSR
jgi:hypothetical protein